MKSLSLAIFVGLLLLAPYRAVAVESACAKATMEILQDLALERVAFDARLVLTNNLLDKDIEKIRVDVEIADQNGNRADQRFFVATPTMNNISAVDGTGVISPQTRGEVHWLIIPASGAGGNDSAGTYYFVGATLSYSVVGVEKTIPIFPDQITVKPMPELYLDYFSPYRVLGDNPFTSEVELPVSFPLALRVLNDGYGPASKLKTDYAQPKIVTNAEGLLVEFKLLGAAVDDNPIAPSLTVEFGNVASKSCATAYWEMTSSLSGRFEKFDVSFTHASELGGELTSLLKETNAHYLVRRIKVNLPGRDDRLDFLAYDNPEESDHLSIYESEIPNGGTDRNAARLPVVVVNPVGTAQRPTFESPNVPITLDLSTLDPEDPSGWIYTQFPDPSEGLLVLDKVKRSDGMLLDPANFWQEEGLDTDYQKTHSLHFVDYRTDAGTPGSYTLIFIPSGEDLTKPTSTLVFSGPALVGETTYLTPQTRIIFTAEDNLGGSGVAQMFRQILGADTAFVAAFLLENLAVGSHALDYYSVDNSGNAEPVKSANLVVDDTAPQLDVALAASPQSFAPQAPAGVQTARQVSFSFTASDTVPNLPVTLQLINPAGQIIRTLEGTALSGTPFSLVWDGLDSDGHPVAAGSYTATLLVSDGLEHLTTVQTTVVASDWFAGTPIDPVLGAQQLYPAFSGTQVVWQDNRNNGSFDIYLKDLGDPAASSTQITSDAASSERPAIDANRIVWQEKNGNSSLIYAYSYRQPGAVALRVHDEFGVGVQENPVVAGDWVAWQEQRNGNWDIWAKNLAVAGAVPIQITNHERDQIRPALSGNLLSWEDYRHGLAEIYTFDLDSGTDPLLTATRLTFDNVNQFLPAADGTNLVWTDQRDGRPEIYRQSDSSAQRLTYGGDCSQAALLGNLLVYTESSAGANDPNLGFLDLLTGTGGTLTTHPARQEEAAIGAGLVAWQDDRSGTFQVYQAELALSELPVTAQLRPGFNLVAIGQLLVDTYGTAAELLARAPAELGIERVLLYSAPDSQYFESDLTGGDFSLNQGAGLIVYTANAGSLALATAGEETTYTLLPGLNQIGLLTVPSGYRAYDLLRAAGLDKVIGVRRFDNTTGLWQSAAVRDAATGAELVGENFSIRAGEGLVVTMKERVDGWKP